MKTMLRALVVVLLANGACLAATPADLIAALSEGRARAEGRAKLVQSCSSSGTGVPAPLLTGYEEARGTFNARIDGIVAHIKTNTVTTLDPQAELIRLNDGLNKVDRFAQSADQYLVRRKCSFYKKMGWGIAAQLAIQPELWRLIWDAYQHFSGSSTERAELFKQLEAQRIPEWTKVRATVVYDSTKSEFVSSERVTWQFLQSGTTKVYVNEWGLSGPEAELVQTSERPQGLSSSFKLFSGRLEKIFVPPSSAPISSEPRQKSNQP